MCVLFFLKYSSFWASPKNLTRTGTQDLRKKRFFEKTGPQVSKTLPFFSSNIKDNVENIHFHVKRRGVQGQVFVPITFENCTLNFYFENGEFGIKKTIANLQPLFAWNVSACLRIFMQPCFQ